MTDSVIVVLTIYRDAVHAEFEQYLQRRPLGWFQDEVSAVAAACERAIMRSAILPELRHLPNIAVETRFVQQASGQTPGRYRKGVAVKHPPTGRRVVMLPGANSKGWLA